MFAYVVMGLWFDSWIMTALGLVVTAFTLVGFFWCRRQLLFMDGCYRRRQPVRNRTFYEIMVEVIMAELDNTIHQPVRLQIMSSLVALDAGEEIEFVYLRNLLELTDGNLGAYLAKLEEAGYVKVKKIFVARKPRTFITATGKGRDAFEEHIVALRQIINGSQK